LDITNHYVNSSPRTENNTVSFLRKRNKNKNGNNFDYHWIHFFSFLFIGREPTTCPANNCLQIMVCSCVVLSKRVLLQRIFCSCVIQTTFSIEKWQIASLSCQRVMEIWTQTWWSNDKTILELGYRKVSLFVSVSQINYFPQPSALANDWSARHWRVTIFFLTSSNNCQLLMFLRVSTLVNITFSITKARNIISSLWRKLLSHCVVFRELR